MALKPRTPIEVKRLLEGLGARGLLNQISSICYARHVTVEAVLMRRRTPSVVAARDAIIEYIRVQLHMSTTETGEILGLDHSTVSHAISRMRGRESSRA